LMTLNPPERLREQIQREGWIIGMNPNYWNQGEGELAIEAVMDRLDEQEQRIRELERRIEELDVGN